MKNVIFKLSVILTFITSCSVFGQSSMLLNQEISDMKYMLEEEKVARDVYEFLDAKWHMRVFNNIKESEQRHMDMIENLLNINKEAYKLHDEEGEFYNNDLLTMYITLIEKGSKSKHDALKVGKTIEILDIEDLGKAKKIRLILKLAMCIQSFCLHQTIT